MRFAYPYGEYSGTLTRMANPLGTVGPDVVVDAVVRLLTPPLYEVYALLVRAGIVVIVDD
jgi:hypothetical protein